jgi:hypothetical protein
MNKTRILELAAVIEQAPHHTEDRGFIDGEAITEFSMSVWRCGTTACIGGWTEALHGKPYELFHGHIGVAKALGISLKQANALCYPGDMSVGRYEDITSTEAADTLRRLAATGKVEWKIERSFIPGDPLPSVEHELVRQMETEFA